MERRAPLDYRYALDAVMPAFAHVGIPTVICNIPELNEELYHRGLVNHEPGLSTAALWIEPLSESWWADLALLASRLPVGGQLYVIASRPIASALPERHGWSSRPLGTRPGGIRRLHSSLRDFGFHVSASYGIHSPVAVGLNILGRLLDVLGRPDLGDRLHIASRLRYCTSSPLASLSAVSLIEATKEHDKC